MSREVAIVITSITGCKELEEIIKTMEGEEIDMCIGFRIYTETIKREAREEAREIVLNEGLAKGLERGKATGFNERLLQGKE